MRAARRAAIVMIGWGALLGIATAVQTPFGPRIIEYGLLGGASAACLVTGIAMWAHDMLRSRMHERPRVLADNSFATATLVAGMAVALVGAGFGLWLILIGAGIATLGAGGLVREALARRRSARPLQLGVMPPRAVPRSRRERSR
jgi:MFS family permease